MDLVLYDICKDALAKSTSASDEDRKLLTAAAANALMLAGKARREGLLALEKAAEVQSDEPDYLKQIVALIVDGREPDIVLEIAANGYWSENPQGIYAMIRYFYIRSMLLTQNGEHPYLIKELFVSLLPIAWREGFLEQVEQVKEQLEQVERKEMAEKFSTVRPSFQNAQLLEKLRKLEMALLGFSDATMQNLLRNMNINTQTVCLYAFQQVTRNKIMNNISRLRGEMLMQDVIWRTVSEEEVLTEVNRVFSIISQLRETREIAE